MAIFYFKGVQTSENANDESVGNQSTEQPNDGNFGTFFS